MEVRINSEFEQVLCEDEIVELPEQKPSLLPSHASVDILHPDYIPPGIKHEPVEQQITSHIIGTLKNLPGPLAKDVKQEIIDTTFQEISQWHSDSCKFTRYLQEKETTIGLCIEDVCTVLDAEQALMVQPMSTPAVTEKAEKTPSNIPLKRMANMPPQVKKHWSHILHKAIEDLQENDQPLPVVSTHVTSAVDELLPVVTDSSSKTTTATTSLLLTAKQPTIDPLPVVTEADQGPQEQSTSQTTSMTQVTS